MIAAMRHEAAEALQFLEAEPWINILTIRYALNLRLLPIAATGQNFQGFRR
jgi:hypothetical protein